MATYTYSLSTDFGGQVCLSTLTDEILAESAITTDLTHIIVAPFASPDDVDIEFDSTLSGGEVTALNGVVAAHDGSVCPEPEDPVDAHVADTTSNPHMITALQVGAAEEVHTHLEADVTDLDKYTQGEVDTALTGKSDTGHTHLEVDITDLDHDAQKIKGVVVDDAAIVDGRVLVYRSASGNLEYEDQTGGDGTAAVSTELAAVQARRTTTLSLGTTFADVTFDTTDEESVPTNLEHNDTNTDRIDVKVDGLYLILYDFDIDAGSTPSVSDVEAQVRVNDTSVLNGSPSETSVFADSSIDSRDDINNHLSHSFISSLSSGDFITVQLRYQNDAAAIFAGGTFKVVKLDGVAGAAGVDGEPGPTGSGSNIIIQDEGVNLPNTPHSIINFVGDGVTATDSTSEATITIPGGGDGDGTFGSEFYEESSDGESSTTSSSWQEKIEIENLDIGPAGKYRVGWYAEIRNSSTSGSVEARVLVGGTTVALEVLEPQDGSNYYDFSGFYYYTHVSGTVDIEINWRQIDTGTAYIRRARIEIWRVS